VDLGVPRSSRGSGTNKIKVLVDKPCNPTIPIYTRYTREVARSGWLTREVGGVCPSNDDWHETVLTQSAATAGRLGQQQVPRFRRKAHAAARSTLLHLISNGKACSAKPDHRRQAAVGLPHRPWPRARHRGYGNGGGRQSATSPIDPAPIDLWPVVTPAWITLSDLLLARGEGPGYRWVKH
jgi:hypothetical protein